MPSATPIVQLIRDLRERKSEIARKFKTVYDYCKGTEPENAAFKTYLENGLRGWQGDKAGLPDLSQAGVTLSDAEKEHICKWPDRLQVRNAMVRALEDDAWNIDFFWDLSDELTDAAASHSLIDPTAARGDPLPTPPPALDLGGSGDITVTFFTPRRNVSEPTSVFGLTFGGVKLEVEPPP